MNPIYHRNMYQYRFEYIADLPAFAAEFLRTWPVWEPYTNTSGVLMRVLGVYVGRTIDPLIAVLDSDRGTWSTHQAQLSDLWDFHVKDGQARIMRVLPTFRGQFPVMQLSVKGPTQNYYIPSETDIIQSGSTPPPPLNSPWEQAQSDVPLAVSGGDALTMD